ncbi:hypothetical protein EYB26_009485 [Talaromyces marneffei]|uniref:uncharacterized protein n=1 Tax=Talaromyces marneffei TaxID=37727 RepID=UPI0012A958C1|nr:uncharacterized protein EYB26_009485 [Talaromyces marneffei]QGA21774.1 hypothetical protein EYB26_009485 [Talaromyces marneffei]
MADPQPRHKPNTTNITTSNNTEKPTIPTIQEFITPITTTLQEQTLYQLSYNLSKTYSHLAAHSTEQFFPTPITHLPTGKERGRYLAVYVGLFYLHVGFIELLGCDDDQPQPQPEQAHLDDLGGRRSKWQSRRWFTVRRTLEKAWPIEERLKLENPVEFFGWIGACIAEVVGDSLRNEQVSNNSDGSNREGYGYGDGEERELVAGISFCFPIVQKSLDEAVLLPTGKGFKLDSDLNLRQALLDGYECHKRPQSPLPFRHEEEEEEEDGEEKTNPWDEFVKSDTQDEHEEGEGRTKKRRKHFSLPKLKIAAMTNDTVATFASLAYNIKSLNVPNSRVVMGLMVGAGSNATVPMKVSDLHPSKTEFFTQPQHYHIDHQGQNSSSAEKETETETETETLVSTEWTLLLSSQPLLDMNILTKWDKIVERQSKPPGFQPMEYIVGGRYMGELVRLIVLDYFTNVLRIPTDVLPWRLLETGGLTTDFLSLNVAFSSSSPSSSSASGISAWDKHEEDEALAKELNQRLSSAKGWTWNAEKAGILRTVAFAVMSRSAAVIAAATVGLLACTGEIQLKDPANGDDIATTTNSSHISDNRRTWNHGPEELVVAYCGGVIQNYPRYKENLQRHIDRLLLHGGPQQGGKSILLREVSDGGIIGVGVLAGSVMGRIEGIVGSKLYDT